MSHAPPGPVSSDTCLVSESPLLVLPTLAKAIGLSRATLLQQLHYYLCVTVLIVDDVPWVVRSLGSWHQEHSWWSLHTLRRLFTDLEQIGLVLSRQDLNPQPDDRTKALTIDYAILKYTLGVIHNDIHRPQVVDFPHVSTMDIWHSRPCVQNGHMAPQAMCPHWIHV